jgi:hypothetical protein
VGFSKQHFVHISCFPSSQFPGGEKGNTYTLLVGKPERKRPLERPRCTWVDNIKKDLREIEWGGMDWIDLT